jgi:hypothetical protein
MSTDRSSRDVLHHGVAERKLDLFFVLGTMTLVGIGFWVTWPRLSLGQRSVFGLAILLPASIWAVRNARPVWSVFYVGLLSLGVATAVWDRAEFPDSSDAWLAVVGPAVTYVLAGVLWGWVNLSCWVARKQRTQDVTGRARKVCDKWLRRRREGSSGRREGRRSSGNACSSRNAESGEEPPATSGLPDAPPYSVWRTDCVRLAQCICLPFRRTEDFPDTLRYAARNHDDWVRAQARSLLTWSAFWPIDFCWWVLTLLKRIIVWLGRKLGLLFVGSWIWCTRAD